ncbi:hypothetical protein F442_22789 [Phytophthora nicotianae P10297]|uniref:Uncharacterized protein n=1 Tax=Phytophthora nicotianae P10297 TaxID=1317064 RepID=W2XYZ3_PHYNI|nr:hypothetical protein F442_22789 [Phytophthora nicotianae P10297]
MSRREPRPRGALNHALHRVYDALLPHRRRDPARLERVFSHRPELLIPWILNQRQRLRLFLLPTTTRSSALVPVASPAHAEPSEELTENSQRDLLAESADATVAFMRTVLLPYLTLMARHQVQLSISPPRQSDVRSQRRLNDALGFDHVLVAVQPLFDTLPDLTHAVDELTAQLKISREEAAAAKRLLVPVQQADS